MQRFREDIAVFGPAEDGQLSRTGIQGQEIRPLVGNGAGPLEDSHLGT